MDGTELTEQLVKRMKGRGSLTIPEILQDLSALGVQTLGERDLLWPGNIVVWHDTTKEAIAAIIALVNDPRSGLGQVSPASVMNYAHEGHVLN
ncbi:hypothetical protein [Cryobacterium sp. SO1]|uniref:hypothetical protein n=1 Tax=Cryobacterium sp. SO1 TaxID=1897061 RepID=UPI001023B48D|nr:hypothetical protein [Cryobacterium sp. SO1]RZI35331.1 hypothetical protein BJQ95_02398 [Cryobacterium sp. SO1]